MLLVLVGCRGAGKSTLLNQMASRLRVLQPSTTRSKRGEADTEYEFIERWTSSAYAWSIKSKDHYYGMRRSELAKAKIETCITVFDPMELAELAKFVQESPTEIVTIGLDTIASLEEQFERVEQDQARKMTARDFEIARERLLKCDVVLRGDAQTVLEAVLVISQILCGRGGTLVREQIEPLMKAGALIKNADQNAIRPASYDMRVGDQIWCQRSLVTLTDEAPTFHLPPYSYAIVIAREEARLPTFVTGHFDLKVSMFLRGTILSNGPQIDPGYDGTLFCLLFNSNSQALPLTRDEQFATIEFVTTARSAKKYGQRYLLVPRLEAVMKQNLSNPGGAIIAMIDSQMAEIKLKLQRLDSTFWAAIAVVNAVLITFGAAFGGVFLNTMWDRVKDAESRSDRIKATLEAALVREEKLVNDNKEALAAIADARAKAIEAINKTQADTPTPAKENKP